MKERVQYYTNLETDDFSNTNITAKPLPKNFKFIHRNIIWRGIAALIYYGIAKPLIPIILKLYYHQKFVNKKRYKLAFKTGAIFYGNHTTQGADTFIPNIVFPIKRNYIIVSQQAMSIVGIRNLTQALGAIPLSDKFSDKKSLIKTIEYRLKQNATITIFPEAHIWMYYNKIRPFDEQSFKYAVKFNVPIYTITNCYQKRKIGKRPKILTFIDGPIMPKPELSDKENALYLRNWAYEIMTSRTAKYSTYEYIRYLPKKES